MKAQSVRPFDVADYLQNDEGIAEYLTQVLADGDTDELIRVFGYVAKARGMPQIAKDSGLGRASLYKALAPGAQPRVDTNSESHARPEDRIARSTLPPLTKPPVPQ